ncbi:MAG: cysteine synthase CysM [Deltaproteobacteria bacterium]|nr:cysteine synthase CysM [Deltaproteobacteria bacterium]
MPANSFTDLIGNTPLLQLSRLVDHPKVKLFAKLEGNNPGSSVKDRAAFYMITGAEKRGELKPGMRIIEPTSGNTGIALAMIAASRGYPIDLVMPENSTRERVLTMKAFGANVILTPADRSMEGAIDYAKEHAKEGEVLMLNQFGNDDNWRAHYETTGPEIWKDTDGKITHFVSAMGTTGTIMGVSRYLKEQNDDVQIVGVQPKEGARIPGIRRWPKEYLPAIFDENRIDRTIDVGADEATEWTRRLARDEGIFCGMSSGGANAAALTLCEELIKAGEEANVVHIVCDRGDRYLTSDLFG